VRLQQLHFGHRLHSLRFKLSDLQLGFGLHPVHLRVDPSLEHLLPLRPALRDLLIPELLYPVQA
jgi:hypothetical protein